MKGNNVRENSVSSRWTWVTIFVLLILGCSSPQPASINEVEYPLVLQMNQETTLQVTCNDGIPATYLAILVSTEGGVAVVQSVGSFRAGDAFNLTVKCASSRANETWRLGTVETVEAGQMTVSMFTTPIEQ